MFALEIAIEHFLPCTCIRGRAVDKNLIFDLHCDWWKAGHVVWMKPCYWTNMLPIFREIIQDMCYLPQNLYVCFHRSLFDLLLIFHYHYWTCAGFWSACAVAVALQFVDWREMTYIYKAVRRPNSNTYLKKLIPNVLNLLSHAKFLKSSVK